MKYKPAPLLGLIEGALALALSWYLMQIVHEAGHVLHCRLGGGRVAGASFPLVGFSQTFYADNPHPLFTVWGGLVFGGVVPLLLLLPPFALWRWPGLHIVRFFAGFCLLANGAYLASGAVLLAGDTHDLAVLGTPRWVMFVGGVPACAAGLWLWNGLGGQYFDAAPRRGWSIGVLMVLVVIVLGVGLFVSSAVPF